MSKNQTETGKWAESDRNKGNQGDQSKIERIWRTLRPIRQAQGFQQARDLATHRHRFDRPFRLAQGSELAEGLKALSLPKGEGTKGLHIWARVLRARVKAIKAIKANFGLARIWSAPHRPWLIRACTRLSISALSAFAGPGGEDQPHHCHRRLVAEYFKQHWGDLDISHLG